MSRLLPILALVVCAGVTAADATPRTSAKKGGKQTATARDRKPTRSTKANMPRGFTWPPSKTMVAAADSCERKLDELGVTWQPAKRVGRVVRPMTLPDAQIGGIALTPVYRKNPIFDCQLVLAIANLAPELHELGVREIRYGSAFRWSKVRVAGKTKNILSRHALGIALDIVSFVDADGREASVARHYKRGDKLLRGVERTVNDSGAFRLLLTPKNDPKSHHDHFHLEANPDYTDPPREHPSS